MKRILVHRSIVDHNRETDDDLPVFTIIDQNGGEHQSSNITISGTCDIKYDRNGADGMRVWIETCDSIILKDRNLSLLAHLLQERG
jgi:hypothetical protein